MSSTNRGGQRDALDRYYTPEPLAAACVGLLPSLRGVRVAEPSVGGGAFAHRNRTGESWALTREAIGYPGTPAALRRRCMVVAEREGLELRMGYPAVKRRRG